MVDERPDAAGRRAGGAGHEPSGPFPCGSARFPTLSNRRSVTLQAMARKPDPVRIYAARRAATEARLRGSGMPQDVAQRWLADWEAFAAQEGLDRGAGDFWERAMAWIGAPRH